VNFGDFFRGAYVARLMVLAILIGAIGALVLTDVIKMRIVGFIILGIASIIVLLIAAAMIFRAVDRARNSQASGVIQAGLSKFFRSSSGGMTPEEEADRDELAQKLDEGLDRLRKTRNSLAEFSLILIVGEPGGGKTQLIRQSGITFDAGLNEPRRGIGGTKGMDWWFAEEAIIIDTAGKVTVAEHAGGEEDGDVARPADNPLWQQTLGFLREHRPRCPINSVIVAIPMRSLLEDNPEEIQRKASHLARSMAVLQDTTGVRCPVTIVVTMSDLLPGYREFVDHHRERGAHTQMLGWSNPVPIEDDVAPFDPKSIEQHCADVAAQIAERRLALLNAPVISDEFGGRRIDAMDALYTFPSDLRQVGSRLRLYLETVFAASRSKYAKHRKPLFMRGVYFASSCQDGGVIDSEVAQLMGVPPKALGEVATRQMRPALAARSNGVQDLFNSKIVKETGLVTQAPHVRVMLRRRNTAIVASFVVAASVVGLIGYSIYSRSAGLVEAQTAQLALLSKALATHADAVSRSPGGDARNGPGLSTLAPVADRLVAAIEPSSGSDAPAVTWPGSTGIGSSWLLRLFRVDDRQRAINALWFDAVTTFVYHPSLLAAARADQIGDLVAKALADEAGGHAEVTATDRHRHVVLLLLDTHRLQSDAESEGAYRVETLTGPSEARPIGPDLGALVAVARESAPGSPAMDSSLAAHLHELTKMIVGRPLSDWPATERRPWLEGAGPVRARTIDAIRHAILDRVPSDATDLPEVSFLTRVNDVAQRITDFGSTCEAKALEDLMLELEAATNAVPERIGAANNGDDPIEALRKVLHHEIARLREWRMFMEEGVAIEAAHPSTAERAADNTTGEDDFAAEGGWVEHLGRVDDLIGALSKRANSLEDTPEVRANDRYRMTRQLISRTSRDDDRLFVETLVQTLGEAIRAAPMRPNNGVIDPGWLRARKDTLDEWKQDEESRADGLTTNRRDFHRLADALKSCADEKYQIALESARDSYAVRVMELAATNDRCPIDAWVASVSSDDRGSALQPNVAWIVPAGFADLKVEAPWHGYRPSMAKHVFDDLAALGTGQHGVIADAESRLNKYKRDFKDRWNVGVPDGRLTFSLVSAPHEPMRADSLRIRLASLFGDNGTAPAAAKRASADIEWWRTQRSDAERLVDTTRSNRLNPTLRLDDRDRLLIAAAEVFEHIKRNSRSWSPSWLHEQGVKLEDLLVRATPRAQGGDPVIESYRIAIGAAIEEGIEARLPRDDGGVGSEVPKWLDWFPNTTDAGAWRSPDSMTKEQYDLLIGLPAWDQIQDGSVREALRRWVLGTRDQTLANAYWDAQRGIQWLAEWQLDAIELSQRGLADERGHDAPNAYANESIEFSVATWNNDWRRQTWETRGIDSSQTNFSIRVADVRDIQTRFVGGSHSSDPIDLWVDSDAITLPANWQLARLVRRNLTANHQRLTLDLALRVGRSDGRDYTPKDEDLLRFRLTLSRQPN